MHVLRSRCEYLLRLAILFVDLGLCRCRGHETSHRKEDVSSFSMIRFRKAGTELPEITFHLWWCYRSRIQFCSPPPPFRRAFESWLGKVRCCCCSWWWWDLGPDGGGGTALGTCRLMKPHGKKKKEAKNKTSAAHGPLDGNGWMHVKNAVGIFHSKEERTGFYQVRERKVNPRRKVF